MTLFNASASQISQITAIENTDIEFVFEGRLYCLVIDQEEYAALSPTIRSYYGEYEDFKTAKNVDFAEIIFDLRLYAEDVTETTDKGQALLKKQARRNLLSYIVSSANKLRSTLKSMSLAMHTAWTKARILASGVVNFVKVDDVDTEAEIVVQRRRVADGGRGKNGLLLFTDLDKYENFLREGYEEAKAKAKSFISMHVWQVVSWI